MYDIISNHYHLIVGSFVAILTMIFGKHWFLFALLLFLNVADWLSGWLKSRVMKTVNSKKGRQGILKIIGSWGMVFFSFMISTGLMEIGKVLEINLYFTTFIGWFVLSSLIINEARSICENFIEAGIEVPKVLSGSLMIADKLINEKEKGENQL